MKCDQKQGGGVCGNEATHRMFWPGKDPINVCEDHKTAGGNIARAMGFHLYFEPIPEPSDETQPA